MQTIQKRINALYLGDLSTAERDAYVNLIRGHRCYHADLAQFEVYDGGSWGKDGGGIEESELLALLADDDASTTDKASRSTDKRLKAWPSDGNTNVQALLDDATLGSSEALSKSVQIYTPDDGTHTVFLPATGVAYEIRNASDTYTFAINLVEALQATVPAGGSALCRYVNGEWETSVTSYETDQNLRTTDSVEFADISGTSWKTVTNSVATAYTAGTDDAAEVYGGVIYVTSAATITLPVIAVGMSLTVITIGAVAVSIDPNASDLIYLDGTALDDGDKITNGSASGDIATLVYYGAAGWYASTNGWTDGGA